MPNMLVTEVPKTELEIDALAKKAYEQVLVNLEKKMSPQDAINKALGAFSDAVLALMATAFSNVLQRAIGVAEMKTYQIGKVTLSTNLYKNAKQTSIAAQQVIREHLKGYIDIKRLTLQLFEGYHPQGYGKSDVLRPIDPLPKYLKRLLGDAYKDADLIYAKAQAESLVTPNLKASYLELIQALETGKGKKFLESRLRTAIYEKSRTYAQRISTTEITRAYNKKLVDDLPKNTRYIQLKPSFNHEPDVCDIFLYANPLGLGQGVYAIDNAPMPTFHTRCVCFVNERLDLNDKEIKKVSPTAERDYFASLDEATQKQVIPSQAQREALLAGMPLKDVINARTPDEYQIQTIGEYRS